MVELVKKFTGGENLLHLLDEKSQDKMLDLDNPSLRRLRDYCNTLDDEIKSEGTQTSRDLIHTYTNIIACLSTTSEEKSSTVSLTKFKERGWKFGKHRWTTARKRLADDSFKDVRPPKRGRKSISPELIKKIEEV